MNRTVRSIARWTLVGLLFALLAGYLVVHFTYNNEALAERITERFNARHRGRLEIERVHWGPGALWALLTRQPAEVTVTGLRLRDSRGRTALQAPKLVAEIRPWRLLLDGEVSVASLRLRGGRLAWDRFLRPDGPSPAGSPHEIGLLGALEPRGKGLRPERADKPREPEAPPREPGPAPGPAPPAPRQRLTTIDGIDLQGVVLTFRRDDTEVVLREVSLSGSLQHVQRPRATDVLALDLSARAAWGWLARRGRRVELADLRAEAHTSTWRGPQPLVISARAHAGQARLRAEGYLQGLTADAPPAVSVALQARRFGGAIARLGLPRLREVDSLLLARLEGPLSDPHLLARLSGVGWDAGWGGARLMGALFDYRDRLVRVHSALVNGWSGQVQGSGWLALHHRAWGVDARLISLRPPRELRNRVEGLDAEVSGLLHTLGSLSFPPRSHTYFHVTANRRSGDSPLPRAIRVMGALRTTPQRLSIHRLLGYSPLGSLDTTGEVLLAGPGPRRLDLRLGVWTRKLRRHLQLRGHRCLVDGVYLRGRLHGELLSPRFDGRLTLLDFRPVRGRGVTLVRIPVLHSPVTLEGGLLHAPDLSHPRYGRYLGGSLQLSLYDGDLHNLHTPRLWFDWGLRR